MALHPRAIAYLGKFATNHGRTFAAAATASKTSSQPGAENSYYIPKEELKVSKVNDVTVASVETNKPLAKVAIYVRAGSRFETDETQGVTQMLRICAGLGTEHHSHFSTTRTLEQNGGILTCTTGREYISYTVEASRNKMENVDKFAKELACYQVFKPWEVVDNVPRLRLERKIRTPEVRIMELIHKTAFRKGLGYSLYCPKWMIGNHKADMLSQFVKSNFVEATVVATGMNHDMLKQYVSKMKLPGGGQRTIQPSKFYGSSELRKETGADLAYVALAIEGAAYTNPKNMVASALVHRALGSGSRTKRGLNAGGKIGAAVAGDLGSKAAATAFNCNYADSGLLGVFIAATPCSVEAVTKKAAEIFVGGGFVDADVVRAKALLKADIAYATENDGGFLEEIGLQTLLTGTVHSKEEIDALVDSVTASDMNSVVSKGKMCMASFGKIANVPYLDQLKK